MSTSPSERCASPIELPHPLGEGPIVLIDDDRLDLRIARRCHKRSGIARQLMTFGAAEDALPDLRRALKASAPRRPSVVIVDLMESRGPGPHGLDVVEELHRLEPSLPIIVLTASAMERFRPIARARGCAAYLRKTARAADLVALFESLGP